MTYRNLQILLGAIVVCIICYARGEETPFARHAAYSLSTIDRLALFDVEDEALLEGAIDGMVDQLAAEGDEHSQFIPARSARRFQVEMRQQFGGIGIRIEFDERLARPAIWGAPEPGTPAAKAGLRAGEILWEVDGVDTKGKSIAWLLDTLRGPVQTEVTIRLRSPANNGEEDIHSLSEREVTLLRDRIPLQSILGDFRYSDGSWEYRIAREPDLALIRLTSFGDHTLRELKRALEKLQEEQIAGVVLDLRNNAGGALESAVGVCDLLLQKGQLIVSVRQRDGEVQATEVATGDGPCQELPMVVLVDRGTASAGEIVAAALQDHRRARIVGERSYGKGTVQRVLRVGPGGESLLKLTTATFWRPSGRNIHRLPGQGEDVLWGIEPESDLQIELTDQQRLDHARWRRERDLLPDPFAQEETPPPVDPRFGASIPEDLILARGVHVLREEVASHRKAN